MSIEAIKAGRIFPQGWDSMMIAAGCRRARERELRVWRQLTCIRQAV
jgi:hypothetical protein